MNDLHLDCPEVTWPRRLNGFIVLGIVLNESGSTAWILFEAENGILLSTRGFIGKGKEFPKDILGRAPVIMASAAINTWRMLGNTDTSIFFDSVKTGEVHISGDFRVFAKNAPLIIRMLEHSGIWNQIDDVIVALNQ